MNVYKRSIAVAGLVALLVSCTASDRERKLEQPTRLLHISHPLTGKIWDVNNKKFITRIDLLAPILSNNYIMLGETHDNILHHQYQAWVIAEIAKKYAKAAIAFEMINESQGKLVQGKDINDTETLLQLLNKINNNWNYEKYYKPVFQSVLKAKFDIFPANLDRDSIVKFVIDGEKSLPEDIKSSLDKNALSEYDNSQMQQEILATHCGMLNIEHASGMVLGQRVRDAVMATALIHNRRDDIAILVAGSGHARKDRGVPTYIRRLEPPAKILSLAWLEVDSEATEIDDYAQQWRAKDLPFDYVWFTPTLERPDPCIEMRKHMKHKK